MGGILIYAFFSSHFILEFQVFMSFGSAKWFEIFYGFWESHFKKKIGDPIPFATYEIYFIKFYFELP